MPKAGKKHAFQPSHELTYGLKVTSRDPGTSKVVSVVCRFCTMFGREENVGGKRKRTSNVKYFTTFRTDNYKQHLQQAHKVQWEQYQALESSKEKKNFFTTVPNAFVNSLDAHMESPGTFQITIKKDVAERIIGELLFHPDDIQGVACERALSLFKKLNTEVDTYVVVLKTLCRFDLCVKYVACGASFRMASRLMDCTRVESGISFYGGCTDAVASNYARVVCAHSLQILSDVIAKTWCFSIALDASTHQGMSYLDTRVRFFWEGAIHNFHLMAIPLFERHSGENMFLVLQRLFDAVFSESWRSRCICMSSDGARNMTGRLQGLVTRISNECSPGLIRIWCGLHELDLVMQSVYEAAYNRQFYSTLTGLIGYLR